MALRLLRISVLPYDSSNAPCTLTSIGTHRTGRTILRHSSTKSTSGQSIGRHAVRHVWRGSVSRAARAAHTVPTPRNEIARIGLDHVYRTCCECTKVYDHTVRASSSCDPSHYRTFECHNTLKLMDVAEDLTMMALSDSLLADR